MITLACCVLLFPACKDDDGPDLCAAEQIDITVEMTKASGSCRDVLVPNEISFGVSLLFEIIIQCGDDCSGRQVSYVRKKFPRSTGRNGHRI